MTISLCFRSIYFLFLAQFFEMLNENKILDFAMTGSPFELSSAQVIIDLAALKHNYLTLSQTAAPADCGVAIKGEAYGLGMAEVARSLWSVGCRTYFVSRPMEGAGLREVLPNATIYVLDGFYEGQAAFYLENKLIPVLISIGETLEWANNSQGGPCAIHVDSGIHRLGFTALEFNQLCANVNLKKALNINLLVSHLACSDEAEHAMNSAQLKSFQECRDLMPEVHASFANSSGIFLGQEYVLDLVRAGVALYGGNPKPGSPNPMEPVVTLQAKVMQTRLIPKGQAIGYSATWTAPRDSRIAILGAGYRDGIPRKLSSSEVDGPAQVFLAGRRVPIVGRVSMDMLACDITDLQDVEVGMFAEIFGPNISVDEAAAWAGTISYELLTHLGNRYHRRYIGGES
jgi:alanine racemase